MVCCAISPVSMAAADKVKGGRSSKVKATCNYGGSTLTFYSNGTVKGRCLSGKYVNQGSYYSVEMFTSGSDYCGDEMVACVIVGNTMYEILSTSDGCEEYVYKPSSRQVIEVDECEGTNVTRPLSYYASYRVNWR